MSSFFVLLLLKPMYGLVDAPLLWQIALSSFITTELSGTRSCFDENFYYWIDPHTQDPLMVWTTHVDDIFAVFTPETGQWAYNKLQQRFGKLKRQQLPLTHIGVRYESLLSGVFMHQHDFVRGIAPIVVAPARARQLQSPFSPS